MCFSAEASFTAAAGLGAVGAVGLFQLQDPRKRLLILIPLLFGIQQLLEGILWIYLKQGWYPSPMGSIIQYFYLFFVFIVWPVWMALSLFVAETDPSRRKWLALFITLGMLYSTYYLSYFPYDNTRASIQGHHIFYQIDVPETTILYAGLVILPNFISSLRYMWVFGVLVTLGLFLAAYSYYHAFFSVWCFFAAIVSISLYFVLWKNWAFNPAKTPTES